MLIEEMNMKVTLDDILNFRVKGGIIHGLYFKTKCIVVRYSSALSNELKKKNIIVPNVGYNNPCLCFWYCNKDIHIWVDTQITCHDETSHCPEWGPIYEFSNECKTCGNELTSLKAINETIYYCRKCLK